MRDGVPVARVQKTTIRTFAVNSEEENEGLRPRISWTLISNIFHVFRCLFPMVFVFFHTFSGGLSLHRRSWTMVDSESAKPMAAKGSLFIVP